MSITKEDQLLGITLASEHKTNHVLHLILTLLTAGVWSWIWLWIASKNITTRNKIKKKVGLPTETNIPKILLVINAIGWGFIFFMFMSASKSQASQVGRAARDLHNLGQPQPQP